MKTAKGNFGLKTGLSFFLLFVLTFVCCQFAFGVSVNTYDSEGKPFYIEKEVEKEPQRFVDSMKAEFRCGNLNSIGFLAPRLLKTRPTDSDVHAMYSIYLVSTGDLSAAIKELDQVLISKKESVFALCAEAMILKASKKYDQAIQVSYQAAAKDASHPYPHNIMGRIYFDKGQYDNAIQSFKKAISLENCFAPAYTNLGAGFFVKRDYAQSVRYFQEAVKRSPDSYQATYGLGVSLETNGSFPDAASAYERCLELKKDDPAALTGLGASLLKAGRYEEALKTGQRMETLKLEGAGEIMADASLHLGDVDGAEKYLNQMPDKSAGVEYLRGYARIVRGKYSEALEHMDRALKANKDHYGAYVARAVLKFYLAKPLRFEEDFQLRWGKSLNKLIDYFAGSVLASQGMWQDAGKRWMSAEGMIQGFSIDGLDERTLRQGVDPQEFRHLNMGVLLLMKNLVDPALSAFDQAIKINQASIFANYWAGSVLLKKGERTKAMAFFEKSLQKAPDFFVSLYVSGELNAGMGKFDVAKGYYEHALNIKEDVGILIKLGVIYEKSDSFEKAEKAYQRVIELSPGFFVGYNQLAWLYAGKGTKLDQAMTLARKADNLQPGNAGILDTIGWLYFQKQQFDQALENLQKAHRVNPRNPTILFHLGKVYDAQGNKSAAKDVFKQALGISGQFEGADEIREYLSKNG